MTNRNSIINVIWETRQPIQEGYCTLKISPGLESEENFNVLIPLENKDNKENKNVKKKVMCA